MVKTSSTNAVQARSASAVRKPSIWISYWFAFSTCVVLWDAGYCFNRPRSMPGGDLAWIWAPYNMVPYGAVDYVYGWPALKKNDGFPNAQALMNLLEATLNVEYLYLRHFSSRTSRLQPGQHEHHYHGHAPLLGFASTVMTCAKTALYLWQDYYCGWCFSGHSSRFQWWTVYIATNGNWVVWPLVVAVLLGRFIATALNREFASQVAYEEYSDVRRVPSGTSLKGTKKENSLANGSASASEEREEVEEEVGESGPARRTRSRAKGELINGHPSLPTLRSTMSRSFLPTVPSASTSTSTSNWRDIPAVRLQPSSSSTSSPFPIPSSGAALPITFTPSSRPCLVVGHNRLAATRVFALLEADARVIVASEKPIQELHEELRYRIETEEILYYHLTTPQGQDNPSLWLDFLQSQMISLVCVTDTLIAASRRSAASAANISTAASNLSIPINISDQPYLSTFNFPSTHRFPGAPGSGPSSLQISVSTNGNGCRLNARIKRDIITKLDPAIGAAVDNIGLLRLKARANSTSRSRSRGRIGIDISDDDPETPLNVPVAQLDTPSLLVQASRQLGKVEVEEKDEQMRRMRWVHQMSEYYSYAALAKMSREDMEIVLGTWQGEPDTPVGAASAASRLPHHDEGAAPGGSVTIAERKSKGRIYLVGSGPGHPGLLTVAAHHILRSATVILSDKLVPAEVLALIPPTTKLHIAKKFPGNNEGAQNEMMELALAAAREGETVVRLKQGDPFVYGRGGEEVLYFRQNGFECSIIPGVSSALAGPLMVGIPVTQRGVAESLVLCTGVGRAGKAVNLPAYVRSRTLALLMGVARINQIVEVLTNSISPGRESGDPYPPYLPIAVIERASSPDQRAIISTLEHVEEALRSMEERPPGMMLIGWAVVALEGEGRVDILDGAAAADAVKANGGNAVESFEREVVTRWMGGQRWKVVEGLGEGWKALGEVGI